MDDIDDQYTPADVESAVDEYWDESDAYDSAKGRTPTTRPFFFVDGPPYTSGQMHLGTAWNKTLKDAIIRHKRMTGHRVTDRPGYDMHGLPIEVKVEEELGFENKRDIEEYGMESFIEVQRVRPTQSGGDGRGLPVDRRVDGLGRPLRDDRSRVHGGRVVGVLERRR